MSRCAAIDANVPKLPQPTREQLAHSAAMHQRIEEAIADSGGWIGFAQYMDLALYAPGLGYYAAGARKFGDNALGGDFVTAPEISPLFAHSLATQVIEVAQRLRQRELRIVEFGAGTGKLARDLLDALQARGQAVQHYAIVEVSPELRQRQRSRLAGYPVAWHDAPPCEFEGIAIANEVLDVMPVRVFVKRDGDVFERGVTAADGGLQFEERVADTALREQVDLIESEVGCLADGYGSEVAPITQAWIRSAGHWLRRGVLLAIDYGFPRREYYHPQRLMGTLMCHYRHRAHAQPLWLPGLNDITAHIDFTAMAEAAQAAGLDVLGYTTQAHFLINCGLLDVLSASLAPARAGAAHRLLSEAEMGELFKVLALGRGLDPASATAAAEPLLGFARGDRRHTL